MHAVYRTYVARGGDAARASAAARSMSVRGARLRVIVETQPGGKAKAATSLAALDGQVDATYGSLMRANVPISNLEKLAAAPGVGLVRAPVAPRPQVMSEGVGEIGASAWQAAGWTGAGVKIGIVDIGFQDYPSLLGTELPPAGGVVVWGGPGLPEDGGDVHGTAVAEIVHDVAPGARLYLARVADDIDLGNATNWLLSQNVDVITMSLSWPMAGLGDGGGEVNDIVTAAVSGGAFWANAAGNQRLGHWMGDFDASTVETPDGHTYNEFEPGSDLTENTFFCSEGDDIYGVLRWQDSWGGATQDYDLELWGWNTDISAWELVDLSTDRQAGGPTDRPREAVVTQAPTTGLYGWSIVRYDASRSAVSFDLTVFAHVLDDPGNPNPHWYDHGRSLAIPADNAAAGFMAAAAVGRGAGYVQEEYSSEGPTRDGRLAPEIAAASGVASSVYSVFAGTSASSPHLAGAAALVLQWNPHTTPAGLESYLRANAVDLGPAGDDFLYGSGRLLLPPPPAVVPTLSTPNVPSAGVGQGKPFTVWGTLDPQFPVGEKSVKLRLYRYRDGKWRYARTYAAVNSDQDSITKYSATISLTTRAKYRFKAYTEATDEWGKATAGPSSTMTVKRIARLGRPRTPGVVKRGQRFTVWGTFKPRVKAGSKTVKLNLYRYMSGAWRYRRTYTAVNANYRTYSRYVRRLTLWTKGSYRFKAIWPESSGWAKARSSISSTMRVR